MDTIRRYMIIVIILPLFIINSSGVSYPEEIDTGSFIAENLKSFVEKAVSLIEEKGEDAFFEFNKKGSTWFNNYTYLIVFDKKGTLYVYPKDFSKVGLPASNIVSADERPFLVDVFRKLSNPLNESTWIRYQWRESDASQPSWKTGFFMKAYPDSGKLYMVGSSRYGIKVKG